MSTKIFVGNFSFSVDEEKLKSYFMRSGTVTSAKVMREGQGGRSRGFGFVEFATPEDAQKAIAEFDGSVWDGRVLKVSEDRSNRRPEGEGYAGGEEGGQDSRPSPIGFFRAQPLDLTFRKRRRSDPFLEDPTLKIDYKDARLLNRFLSEKGRILPRRMTGLTAMNQRRVSRAVKRAHQLGILTPGYRG